MPVLESEQTYTYDEVPYQSAAFAQTHPDRLATIGSLFGMNPVPVTECRVLELGCASGGNLIPMACSLPQAQFVGVDLSNRQISEGLKSISDLNLNNIQLKHMNLVDIDKDFGTFDYIIAHGLYSWVGAAEQDKILEICNTNLAPSGVAYISYNTFPGWHFRGMIRDMMLYHAGHIQSPEIKAAQSRALLDFLSQSVPTQDNAYGIMLKNELDLLRNQGDYYLIHDHLEDVNSPVYFHQFAEKAATHGLQYLGEADFHTMLTSNFSKEVDATLKRISTEIVRTEQYMDFVRNRTFRQTLLCHKDVNLNRNVNSSEVMKLRIASPLTPASADLDVKSNKPESFVLPNGVTITSGAPLTKAAFKRLSESWPAAESFDDLFNAARASVFGTSIQDKSSVDLQKQALSLDILMAYAANAVDLRTENRAAALVSDKPKASAIARHQGGKQNFITSELHNVVPIDVFSRHLLALLDGTRDKEAILHELVQLAKSGVLDVQHEGKLVKDDEQLRKVLGDAMNESLIKMHKAAIFVD